MEDKSSCNIEVLCQYESWNDVLASLNSIAADACVAVLGHVDLAKYVDILEISVLFTDDSVIQDLNARFRNKDKATNVLSFPSFDINPDDFSGLKNYTEEGESLILGDMILAYETVVMEAKEQNKTLENHVKHLIVHSVLHLLGYDHIDDEDAKEMEEKEIEILAQMGIENPYLLIEDEVS